MEEKRNWTHHIKRLILENHHTTIPQKVSSWGVPTPAPNEVQEEGVLQSQLWGSTGVSPSGHWLLWTVGVSSADATGLSTALWASWSSQSESVGRGRHDTWQGSNHVGFLPFQAKEAILEMDSYCKYTLSACFVPNCAPL